MRLFVAMSVFASATMVSAGDRVTGKHFATRSEVFARGGMAATSQPLATQVAIDILKKGGNAIDAAIGANAVLALTEPTGCGLGGDLFAIIWDAKTKRLYGLNASGRSPRKLTMDVFREKGLKKVPPYGVLPISVPGCVDGWFELHKKFGKLPMKDILAPAIKYAKEGFPVSEVIASYWSGGARVFKKQPGFAETFLVDGKAPKKGDLFKNPGLARTLQALADDGRDVFYKGRIAKRIAGFVQKHGGYLSFEDLAAHKSEWVEPVSINYRGYRLWELPPNGQGIAAQQILQILKGYDLKKAGFGSVDHLHYFTEAKKLAFEDRAKFYADPTFGKIPVAELISDAYAKKRRGLIQDDKAAKSFPAGNPALEDGDTIYLTTADKDRNFVSLIQSNFRGFGSGVCPTGLGFSLQDRGELFDLTPGRANSYAPGKRPFHTIIPAFVTKNDQPFLSFGVMGGATQPQAHAQIMLNIIDFGMNLQEAGDAPRIVHTGSSQPTGEKMRNGGEVHLESGFASAIPGLEKRGHKIGKKKGLFGGYQAIGYDAKRNVLIGASESRKDGHAAGY